MALIEFVDRDPEAKGHIDNEKKVKQTEKEMDAAKV